MLHVALLDDHPAVVAGLRRLIDPEPDLAVLAAAADPGELARQLDGRHADVLVLDYDPSRGDGLAHCRRVKDRPSAPAVIVYSAYASPGLVLAAHVAQADAVVDKSEPVHVLLTAIRGVADGRTLLPVVPRDAFETAVAKLDDDDLPVLAMLLDRQPVDAIAQALRTERTEIAWRAKRIVGRLRPKLRRRSDEQYDSASGLSTLPRTSAPPERPRPS